MAKNSEFDALLIYEIKNKIVKNRLSNMGRGLYAMAHITAITNSNISLNSSNTLKIAQIDEIFGNLTSANYTVENNDSIIVITQPNPCANVTTIIGAAYETKVGPVIINTDNREDVTDLPLRAAGIVDFTTQCNVTSFNMLIIRNPTIYQNIDNSTNSTVVSSIVIAKVKEKGNDPVNVVIDLYFQVLTSLKPTENGKYLCAFYDTNTLQWNESGCTEPNRIELNRFRCECHHLTSFALIWLPEPPSSVGKRPELDAQDKASIAFQLLSIICFLGIVIHGITVRILNPQKYTQTRHLLPLFSYGITMILFIFYIALGFTVYSKRIESDDNTETAIQRGRISGENFNGRYITNELISRADSPSTQSSSSNIPCLSSEYALMFIVYFFIIFMFCSKTSIGIDNYRRYVQLFPPPSPRMLILMMVISFFISIICLAFAVGFNSRPSNEIAGIYLNKLCWFNRNVIHYFFTIPICIFLAINLAMFIPVAKNNITHAQIEDEEDRSYYVRRKRCVYILLTSCVTQGFGWLFGPMIFVANQDAAKVLEWFFVVFNGLEGVWAILLYIVVEREGMNDTERYRDSKAKRLRGDEIDVPQKPLNGILDGRRSESLANLNSISPRNSFTDFSETQIHHRSYEVNQS